MNYNDYANIYIYIYIYIHTWLRKRFPLIAAPWTASTSAAESARLRTTTSWSRCVEPINIITVSMVSSIVVISINVTDGYCYHHYHVCYHYY